MSFRISIIFLNGNFGPSVLVTFRTKKVFNYSFGYSTIKEFKKVVILTFHIGKLSPSNLGGQ